ncbi:MAG: HAMP domain-containing protein [Deltaproteobacteria bacterium]|nr:MAG: HAMP domain-containing protein [Deltaproteobacteria bacterium]
MKKKILIGLGIGSLLFMLLGAYIIVTVERATLRLDQLVKLHQVEILRGHLLLQIKRVQTDLAWSGTRYANGVDTIVSHGIQMGKVIDRCFRCHHSPQVMEGLVDLKSQTEKYEDFLSHVLTLDANRARREAEKDEAIQRGQDLIATVNGIIALTSRHLESSTQAVFRQIAITKTMLFLLIAMGLLILMTLGFFFIRALTSPMNILLTATRRLKGGALDHRVEGLKDEFGELATSFNEMAGSLKEQMQKMRRTEQMVVVGELAAGLGHEVMNPLAGIKAAMNLLSEELALNKEDRDLFSQIVEQVVRLEALMKAFLNFAKPPKPHWERVSINGVLATTIDFYLVSHRPSSQVFGGIDIRKSMDDGIPRTMADPIQLQQVFLNLFLNADDAMPNGGALAVRTLYDASADSIRIDIKDTGTGIDPEILGRIFSPFLTTKPKGTGLGLAICKQIIEQHDGSIRAENDPAGGALFYIVLPVKRGEEEVRAA